MKNVTIKENPKYIDKYLVKIKDALYSMSHNATSPQGVNMYLGGTKSDVFNNEKYQKLKEIKFKDAPKQVQEAIKSRLNQ